MTLQQLLRKAGFKETGLGFARCCNCGCQFSLDNKDLADKLEDHYVKCRSKQYQGQWRAKWNVDS